jgi:hypothetical protein
MSGASTATRWTGWHRAGGPGSRWVAVVDADSEAAA